MRDDTLANAAGISFVYNNLYGDNMVSGAMLAEISDKIKAAASAVAHMRKSGEVKGHLSKDGQPEKVLFSQLPYVERGHINTPESMDALAAFGAGLRNRVDAVISFGIGGSFLGNKVLFDVGCGEFWNQKGRDSRSGWPQFYFSGNNVDGARTDALLREIAAQARALKENGARRLYKISLIVISKSGATLETMACFMYALAELDKQKDVLEVEVTAVTDPAEGAGETLLHKLARENGWRLFCVPDGVGGRFSVFSDVGLVTAAAVGLDFKNFLAGARDMDKACQSDDPYENMALLNAALKFLAAEKFGRDMEVFMPYADSLKSLAEWYIQLLAESLGKGRTRDGLPAHYGRTPIAAVGTTDMHAQTQQHQEGKLNKVVQFVKVAAWDNDPAIPNYFPQESALGKISGVTFSKAMNAALEANAEALAGNGRFCAVFVLPRLNLYYLGALMYLLALSIAYEGELANVDAFDQPGVEAYKKILKVKMAALQK
ncbi:MAG: glucose-6-phosphate isomerase [Acidaminococcales bacterium]|jgi:glucose-6-phosphate isomerase|nr:glucose-6-phosphate isomerase [Acidaminococcales bacterium]